MNFINEYKNLVEFIYFISGPLMFLGIIIAIRQLHFIKKEANQRFTRETILISLNMLDKKTEHLSKLQDLLWDAEANAEAETKEDAQENEPAPEFDGKIDTIYIGGINNSDNWLSWLQTDEAYDVLYNAITLCNELESISHYIYSGIIDEEMCFNLQGNLIISYIESNLHYIAQSRKTHESSTYEGIIKLYSDWHNKIKRDTLVKKHKKLSQEIKDTPKPTNVKVIGKDT